MSRALALDAPRPSALPEAAGALSKDGVCLLAAVLILTGIGLVMVYSTTAVAADRVLGDSFVFLRKQVMWALIAGITLVLMSATDYRALLRMSRPLLAVLAGLLVLCLFQEGRGGARRWLNVMGMGVQPSELGKVLLVLYCAERVGDTAETLSFKELLKVLVPLGGIVGLVAIAPDFGTALFLSGVAGTVLVVAGIRLRHLVLLGMPAVLAGAAVMVSRFDHVRTRIEVFLHPEADLSGKGYQIHQALIALGSGGPLGLGLGQSRQKLSFLPDDHTDFILAILGEELGLIGTLAVAGLFALVLVFGIRIALGAPDRKGFLAALGLTLALALQGVTNIAVVTASVPTKGISLPFISYGGSALVVAYAGVGILLQIASKRAPAAIVEDPS